MKSSSIIASGIAGLAPLVSAAVSGFDISGYQPTVDFAGAYADGARFVMIKVRSLGRLNSSHKDTTL